MLAINEIRAEIESARAAYMSAAQGSEAEWRPLSDRVKALQAELSAAISEGANPCPGCGVAPLGMVQQVSIRHKVREEYEIGCPRCANHRGETNPVREAAVMLWNAGKYQ